MPLRQKHFTQHTFTRPKRGVFQRDGDFFKCYGLAPVLKSQALERVPTWSALVDFPATPAHIAGAFYDHANGRYVFLDGFEGQGTDIRSVYFNASWTASGWATLVAGHVLGGLVYRNVHYWAGYIWFLDHQGDLYQTTSYTAGPAPVYQAGLVLRIIWPIGDHMYAVDNDGVVYRSNEGSIQLDAFFAPDTPLDVRWMCAYRQYICLVARSGDGTFQILRLPDLQPLTMGQLATTLHTSGRLSVDKWALNFALHDDMLYLIPGIFTRTASGISGVLHRFNGTYLERLNRADWTQPVRLVPWRGRLLAVQHHGGQHYVDQLLDEEWVRMLDCHPDQVARAFSYPKVWNLGEELVCTMANGSAAPALRHVGKGDLCDGWLITSAYDMGLPARQKRLNHITVHTDVDASTDTNFKIIVKYRIDDHCHDADADNWTTAVTANATPRAVTAELGVEFYLLQVRVDVDDDSGNNLDRRIDAITIDYSAGD